MKAFIVNRVGDFGFALGIFGLFYLSGSVVFGGEAGLFAFFEQYNPAKDAGLFGFSGQTTLNILLFLLFMGAMGKSAQLFLQYLVARRDGRPDTSIGLDPRSYHGNSGRVHGGAFVAGV